MNQPAVEPIHTLEIPTGSLTLLVPSACIAEVVNVSELAPLPGAPNWVMGVAGWRARAVPVISFERLLGLPSARPETRSKFIVFYPLPSCQPWNFFALLASGEPQPRTLDNADTMTPSADLSKLRYIAMGVKVDRSELGIPDFEALRTALFPSGPR